MQAAHSILSPSSAGIWCGQGCTAYPLMAEMYPEEEGEKARDGTQTHSIADVIIDAHAHARFPESATFFGASEEQYDAAKMYADNVEEVIQKSKVFGGPNFGSEQRVECRRIHAECFGTCDCFLFDRNNGVLYVWDFKYGFGLVEVYENWQLLCYVAGLLDRFEIDGLHDQNLKIVMRIVQPRGFHKEGPIREWSCMASDLRGYFNRLRSAAAEVISALKQCKSGPLCRNCEARHACDTALKAGVQLYEAAAAPAPLTLTPEALGVQLTIVKRAAEQIGSLLTGYEEQVKALMRKGANVPGWMIEPGGGKEKWNIPDDEVEAIGLLFGKDLKKKGVLTPNQTREAGIDPDVVKGLTEVVKKGVTIVPDTGAKARKVFG